MNVKVNFGESLKEILNNKKIKINDFAKAINVSKSTVYSWLSNSSEPKLSYLVLTANYLNCTIEFLIGRSNEDSFVSKKAVKPFALRVREIMKEADISTYKLRNISKYDGAYFYNWEHGSEPYLSTLLELSCVLDCTIDYLIGMN